MSPQPTLLSPSRLRDSTPQEPDPLSTTRPTLGSRLTPRLTPQALADLHNDYYSALWRGDAVAHVTAWWAAHWREPGPPEPTRPPEAVSPFGGVGRGTGIRWYRLAMAIVGYGAGSCGGCFVIQEREALPALPSYPGTG